MSCCASTATPTSSNTPRQSARGSFNAIADHYRRSAVRREQPAGRRARCSGESRGKEALHAAQSAGTRCPAVISVRRGLSSPASAVERESPGSEAEGEGFEPSVRLPAQRFSRPPDSTTLAPLRGRPQRSGESRVQPYGRRHPRALRRPRDRLRRERAAGPDRRRHAASPARSTWSARWRPARTGTGRGSWMSDGSTRTSSAPGSSTPPDTLDFVPPWYGERILALGDAACGAHRAFGPVGPGLLSDLDPVLRRQGPPARRSRRASRSSTTARRTGRSRRARRRRGRSSCSPTLSRPRRWRGWSASCCMCCGSTRRTRSRSGALAPTRSWPAPPA